MISIIVTCYNNALQLEQCLHAIRQHTDSECELIVVDDGSLDRCTADIARKYGAKTFVHSQNQGRNHARSTGIQHARGDLFVFIDSDVLIQPGTLHQVKNYFQDHPEVDALCGMLSKDHPNSDFFSQYKNLYMYNTFKKLPQRINFLYGSIHAIRRAAITHYSTHSQFADDTEIGQKLIAQGKIIHFLHDLEVVHLKKYSFVSFIKNDFRIPFDWAAIFLRFQGWKQLGIGKTGYLHASQTQLASLALASLSVLCLALFALGGKTVFFCLWMITMSVWLIINRHFWNFLRNERGVIFFCRSVFITFLDHLVMTAGILCGFLAEITCSIKHLLLKDGCRAR